MKLKQLQDDLGDLKAVRFTPQVVGGVGLVICSYMIDDPEIWKRQYGTEARGITFRESDGECVSRPFRKFFNVGERADTQPALIQYQYECAFYDRKTELTMKRDGSLITPVVVNGKVYLKTKKSFTSDVAICAQFFLDHDAQPLQSCIKKCMAAGFTPIFEFTSPDNMIVINYGDSCRLTLIAIRHTETGEFCLANDPTWNLFDPEAPFVKRIDPLPDWNDLVRWQQDKEGEEGWVLFVDGKRVKMKTEWYLKRHRLMDVRVRDVADMTVNETLDDLMADMIQAGKDLDQIRIIQRSVIGELLELNNRSNAAFELVRNMPSRKDQAVFLQKNAPDMMAAVMAKIDGKLDKHDRVVKKLWADNHRLRYSLRSITNPAFGNSDE